MLERMHKPDSHHEQVMKARAEADPNARKLYFAYSTILDRAAFEAWKEHHGASFFELPEGSLAEALDVDLVYDFPSRWWGGRVAGLVDRPSASVWGRLFEISGPDWPIIQHKEGVVSGMCVEREVRVRAGGKEVRALAFTTHPARASQEGQVSRRFVEALVRGATSAGLPAEYVDRLRSGAGGA